MIVGFTGTRIGMTQEQEKVLFFLLKNFQISQFHHGDCAGADAQAHKIAEELNIFVVIHPPVENGLRAFCKVSQILPEESYLVRDRNIVDRCDLLIGTPKNYEYVKKGSGTWYTIKYGKDCNKDVLIIFPDGTIKFFGRINKE